MIMELVLISLVYFLVFLFWSSIKYFNNFTDRLIFCQTCFTFASIFFTLLVYFIITGEEILPLKFLMGLTFTGIAYKIQGDFDRLKKKKEEIIDKPYEGFVREFLYQTRLFWFELILLNIGLILIRMGVL